MKLDHFTRFLDKRERIRRGEYVRDAILQGYRFCNINREDDRVTRWIHENVRVVLRHERLQYAVVQLLAARVFNEPTSLQVILPIPLNFPQVAQKRAETWRNAEHKVMRGAYMMPAHRAAGKGKTVIQYWFGAIEEASKLMYPGMTLEGVAVVLKSCTGIGDFISNQVCADLRYTPGHNAWDDWETFVLAGPGTRRGLNRLHERALNTTTPDWPAEIHAVQAELRSAFPCFKDPNNVANSFCEYDKYCRGLDQLTLGQEVTLRRYTPYGVHLTQH